MTLRDTSDTTATYEWQFATPILKYYKKSRPKTVPWKSDAYSRDTWWHLANGAISYINDTIYLALTLQFVLIDRYQVWLFASNKCFAIINIDEFSRSDLSPRNNKYPRLITMYASLELSIWILCIVEKPDKDQARLLLAIPAMQVIIGIGPTYIKSGYWLGVLLLRSCCSLICQVGSAFMHAGWWWRRGGWRMCGCHIMVWWWRRGVWYLNIWYNTIRQSLYDTIDRVLHLYLIGGARLGTVSYFNLLHTLLFLHGCYTAPSIVTNELSNINNHVGQSGERSDYMIAAHRMMIGREKLSPTLALVLVSKVTEWVRHRPIHRRRRIKQHPHIKQDNQQRDRVCDRPHVIYQREWGLGGGKSERVTNPRVTWSTALSSL